MKRKERHQKKLDNLVINKRINEGIQKNTSLSIKKLITYWTKWWQNCSVEAWFKTCVTYQKLYVTVRNGNSE